MKNITINQKSFTMPKSSADLLQKYLDRLNSFVKKNNIDTELLHDIEARISEKISTLDPKKIDHKFMINFIDSLGEPQQIFEDEDLNNSVNIPIPDLSDVKETIETSGKFLGKNLSKFATFIKEKTEEEAKKFNDKKAEKKTQTSQKNKTESSKNIFTTLISSIAKLIKWKIKMISKIFKNIKQILGWILKKAWLAFGFLLATLASIWLILALPIFLSFSDFSINNQQLFAAIPTIAAYGFGLLLFGFLIISIKSLAGILQKKWIPKTIGFVAFFSLIAGIIITIYSGAETAKYYSKSESKIITKTFEIADKNKPVTINDLSKLSEIRIFGENGAFDRDQIFIKPATNDQLTIKITATTLGNNQAVNFMNPLTWEENGQTITAKFATEEKFSQPTPFTFLKFRSEIFIPKDVKINGQIINELPWWKMRDSNLFECRNDAIFFDENDQLTCASIIPAEEKVEIPIVEENNPDTEEEITEEAIEEE